MPERKPIFYDQERRRWRRTRLVLEVTGALFTLVLVVFLLNVVRNPELPELLRPARAAACTQSHSIQKAETISAGPEAQDRGTRERSRRIMNRCAPLST